MKCMKNVELSCHCLGRSRSNVLRELRHFKFLLPGKALILAPSCWFIACQVHCCATLSWSVIYSKCVRVGAELNSDTDTRLTGTGIRLFRGSASSRLCGRLTRNLSVASPRATVFAESREITQFTGGRAASGAGRHAFHGLTSTVPDVSQLITSFASFNELCTNTTKTTPTESKRRHRD